MQRHHARPRRPRPRTFARRFSGALEILEGRALLSLVASYSFDQGSGTVLKDLSGNGNDGTISNAAWTAAGKFGGALSFTGALGSWVTINDAASLQLTTGMTLEAWVDPSSLAGGSGGWIAAISKEHVNSNNDISYALYAAEGANTPPAGHVLIGSVDYGTSGGSPLPVGAWSFLTATYNGSTLSTYVNGTLVSSVAKAGKIFTTTDPLRIGGDWSGEMFSGSIDNVRIYNTALTAAQIQADMNTSASPDTTPPTSAITAPDRDSVVSGTVPVTIAATDNVAVASVQLQLDGVNLGPALTSSPYTYNWDTTGASNTGHNLTAIAVDTSGNATTSAPIHVTVSNATNPVSVALTSPADGMSVSGSVALAATASDTSSSIAGVQFLLDGIALGAEVTSSPYTLSWDSTTSANGSHTLAARARDTLGNVATSTVAVTVANDQAGNPAVVGQWSAVSNWPLVAINMVLLKTGKVLMWDGGPTCIGATSTTLYDPATGTFTPVPSQTQPDVRDLFCSGATVLVDGRVLIAGGHECQNPNFIGSAMGTIFDPTTQTWTQLADMAYRRWYPTATTLPDGRALVTAGSDVGDVTYDPIPEIYDPVSNTWTKLSGADQTIPNYPFMFVMPDGTVLAAGSDEAKMATYSLNVAAQKWSVVDPTVLDAGSAVEYLPGKIMKAGSSYLSVPPDNGGSTPSAATTYVLDGTQANPRWTQTASMANPRTHLNLTILPDDTVLATGGSTDIGGVNTAHAVYAAEMWSPTAQTWSTMASEQVPRLYHSTALLLPDGRVLVAGGGHNYYNNLADPNSEIYSPPYLFKGARPTITTAPATIGYGSAFFVGTPDAANIASVSLIADGAVTHSFNMDQHLVPLSFVVTAGGLTVTAPANSNLATPGYYMLFIVNKNGVPSIAPIVQVPLAAADTTPPSAPTNLSAVGGAGTVALAWSASSDNVGVVGYNVYRSTTPGFTPSAANLVGQATVTTYTDAVAAGTYYYAVAAYDAAGNLSAPSGLASATVTAPATNIQLVQHATAGFEYSTSNLSVSFAAATKPGSFLIVTGTAARPRSTLTISDTAGDTFVQAMGPVTDASQDVNAYIWYVVNAKGGADTVTITPGNGSDALEIHVSEWTGIDKVAPLDQTASATGSGTTLTSGTKTTTANGELIFGYTFPNQNASHGVGFADISYINGDLDEYQIQNISGPAAATYSQSPADTWLVLMATFRPAVSDTQAPTAPGPLTATGALGSVALAWGAATDNVGVAGYNIYRSTAAGFVPGPATLLTHVAGLSYTDPAPAGTYYYLVTAYDAAGNEGPPSNQAAGTSTADTLPPTAPGPLSASGAIGSVALAWGAATDNVGVAGYNIYRSTAAGFVPGPATLLTRVAGLSYTDPAPAGTYYYLVTAYDAAGNEGPPSNQAAGTSTADTLPPTVSITSPAPGSNVSGTVNLTASAADNVGVASIQFQLDGVNLGPLLTKAPYTYAWDTTKATNSGHSLTAIALDTSGNAATSSAVAVTVNNANLVASYAFSEGSGTTTADGSGLGNNGTLSGPTWTTSGKSGDALTFNGSTAVVVVKDAPSLHLTTGMTLEAWVDPTTLASPDAGWVAAIAKEYKKAGNDISYALYAAAGTGTSPAVHVYVRGVDYGAQGGGVVPLNTWTFLSGTYDGSTLRMYVNGTLVGSTAVSGSIAETTDTLKIGGDWSKEMFTGTIDSVRISNKALTQAQIQADMATNFAAVSFLGPIGNPARRGGQATIAPAFAAVSVPAVAPAALSTASIPPGIPIALGLPTPAPSFRAAIGAESKGLGTSLSSLSTTQRSPDVRGLARPSTRKVRLRVGSDAGTDPWASGA